MEENGRTELDSIVIEAREDDPGKSNTEITSKLVAFDSSPCVVSNISTKNSIYEAQLLSNEVPSKDISAVSANENPYEVTLVQMKGLRVENGMQPCIVLPKQVAAEEPSAQNCFSVIENGCINVEVISSDKPDVICSREEENITCTYDGNEKTCEEQNFKVTNKLAMETKTDEFLAQKTVCNIECVALKQNKNQDEKNEILHYSEVKSHKVFDELQETCFLCCEKNSRLRTECFENSKDVNFEAKENDTIQELSCCIYSNKLNDDKSVLQNKRKSENVCIKTKNISESETDVNRPPSSVSNSSSNFSGSSDKKSKRENVEEIDPSILSRRQKQIDYGKNTSGYRRYREVVPKDQRTRQHPQTPPKSDKYSRRAWDGLIKTWRRKLHDWDPPKPEGSEADSLKSSSSLLTLSDDSDNLPDISTFSLEKSVTNEVEMNGVSNNEESKLHKLE